jgi:hypothetical protein
VKDETNRKRQKNNSKAVDWQNRGRQDGRDNMEAEPVNDGSISSAQRLSEQRFSRGVSVVDAARFPQFGRGPGASHLIVQRLDRALPIQSPDEVEEDRARHRDHA